MRWSPAKKMSLLILDLEQNLIHRYRNIIKFIQTQNRTETEIKAPFGQDINLPESGTIAKVLRLCHQPYYVLCPFALYYLRYAVTSFFTLSRISLADGKRAGQKVQRKIAAAVQNVKRLYFLSRSFEISETNCQQSFFLP